MAEARKPRPNRMYSGVLNEPIRIGRAGDPNRRRKALMAETTMGQRLPKLYEHYGIQPSAPGAAERLILALAKDHVPGFQIESETRGRPTKWKYSERSWHLFADVQVLLAKGHSDANACRILARRRQYRGENARSLLRRYQEANENGPVPRVLRMPLGENGTVGDLIVDLYRSDAQIDWEELSAILSGREPTRK